MCSAEQSQSGVDKKCCSWWLRVWTASSRGLRFSSRIEAVCLIKPHTQTHTCFDAPEAEYKGRGNGCRLSSPMYIKALEPALKTVCFGPSSEPWRVCLSFRSSCNAASVLWCDSMGCVSCQPIPAAGRHPLQLGQPAVGSTDPAEPTAGKSSANQS